MGQFATGRQEQRRPVVVVVLSATTNRIEFIIDAVETTRDAVHDDRKEDRGQRLDCRQDLRVEILDREQPDESGAEQLQQRRRDDGDWEDPPARRLPRCRGYEKLPGRDALRNPREVR